MTQRRFIGVVKNVTGVLCKNEAEVNASNEELSKINYTCRLSIFNALKNIVFRPNVYEKTQPKSRLTQLLRSYSRITECLLLLSM